MYSSVTERNMVSLKCARGLSKDRLHNYQFICLDTVGRLFDVGSTPYCRTVTKPNSRTQVSDRFTNVRGRLRVRFCT